MKQQMSAIYSNKSVTVFLACLVIAVLLFAAAKEFGVIDPGLAKRGVGVSFGMMVIIIGNIFPKIVRPLSERGHDPVRSMTSARFAGRAFVLAGLVYVFVWILAPLDYVELYSSVVGLGAFGLVGVNFSLRGGGERPGLQDIAIIMFLFVLAGIFAIFLIDYLWGDRASQRAVIGFVIAMVLATQWFRSRMQDRTGDED